MTRLRFAAPALLLLAVAATADDKPVVTVGKLKAPAPAEWKSEKPANRLRSFQFRLPAGDPGRADAEVAVYPQDSPKVDDKFAGWRATYMPPDGKTLDDVAKATRFEVAGATVHRLDVSGTWKYRERPRDPKSKEELRPEYRTVWVVVVDGDEATQIRLSGPEKVVAKYADGFDAWVRSLK